MVRIAKMRDDKMVQIEIISDFEDIKQLEFIIKESGFDISISPTFSLDADGIIHLLTIGGGLAGLAKCINTFINIHYQKRKVRVRLDNQREFEIEGVTIKELEKLLRKTKSILLENNEKK